MSLPGAVAQAQTPDAPGASRAPASRDTEALRERARVAFSAGLTAYNEKQYAAAEAHFARADSLLPSVQAKFWRAMSLDQLGNPAGAYEAFRDVMAQPDKDELGADKLAIAEKRLRELSTAPATLSVTTTPPGAQINVSGVDLATPSPAVLKLAPGRHVVRVSLDGYETQERELDATPGAKLEPSFELVPARPEAAAPAPENLTPPPTSLPAPAAVQERSRVPGYVTLGIAGASAVVGTIFGLRALADKDKFNDAPSTRHADNVERNALIADMAFGVTLTLGITGIVLLVADDPVPEQAKASAPVEGAQLRLLPYVSPSGGGAAAHVTF